MLLVQQILKLIKDKIGPRIHFSVMLTRPFFKSLHLNRLLLCWITTKLVQVREEREREKLKMKFLKGISEEVTPEEIKENRTFIDNIMKTKVP